MRRRLALAFTCGAGQCASHRLNTEALDQVADLDVIEVVNADTTLEALTNFAHVILEAFQAADFAFKNLDAIPNQPHACLAIDDAFGDLATGDEPDLRHLEGFAHLRRTEHHFLLFWRQQALERGPHIFDRFVDDAVQLDVHAFTRGECTRVRTGSYVEADDDGTRGCGQQH